MNLINVSYSFHMNKSPSYYLEEEMKPMNKRFNFVLLRDQII